MYKYILLISLIFFTGCSTKNLNEKEEIKKEESNKKYIGISKDAVFEAAKKVFLLASKEEFRIDSYRNKLIVSKTKMSHYPLYAVTHEDFWTLTIEEENDTSDAKLNIHRITDYDDENPEYYSKEYHRVLWSRIDYLLGLNNTWESCGVYTTGVNEILCDSIDMSNPKKAKKRRYYKRYFNC